MDYSIGSVAALISGNVTPNRPKLVKRALTPMKHQPSPNVTPKSDAVDDRSIFMSPSLQRKKAMVKKSPKRIFQNPDLDVTNDGQGMSTLLSPKADKVKKHLKDDLDADHTAITSPKSPKSPKKGKTKIQKPVDEETSQNDEKCRNLAADLQALNENTPKKKKKQRNSISMPVEEEIKSETKQNSVFVSETIKSKKKKRKSSVTEENIENVEPSAANEGTPKKKRKVKNLESQEPKDSTPVETENQVTVQNQPKKKKNKKKKNKNKKAKIEQNKAVTEPKQGTLNVNQPGTSKKKSKDKTIVNPNAITNKDSDSEHESDNEIESETEQINNQVLDTGPVESSDDEDDQKETKKPQKQKKEKEESNEEEVNRTLFVGNVPLTPKCKKEIKKIFSKHGEIETVRIRTVPVKDARYTPKLALIKNELHPERSTVNVYVKYKDASSVNQALVENNTVLNENHLRVTRSDVTGSEHDPSRAVFVGNLPFALEDETLRAKFEHCGEIQSVRVVRDRKTNAGKGFGYVNFASKDGVELALSMSEEDLTIKNRILRVKRCSLLHKGKPGSNQERHGGRNHGPPQGRNQRPYQERNQGPNREHPSSYQGRNQGPNQGRNQRPNQGSNKPRGTFQKGQARSQGRNQRMDNPGTYSDNVQERNLVKDGAYRRIMNKRENEEPTGGPPSKVARQVDQPREKKPRKEFVGMTSEKKKKHKFDKGQKKKKALSEILTKYS